MLPGLFRPRSAAAARPPAAAALGTIAAAAVGAGVLYRSLSSNTLAEAETATPRPMQHPTSPPPRIFGSGPAFASLRLESSTQVTHNTKLLRFAFPREDAVSGLRLTCAVLTFSWPQGCWLPVLRPYTPVSKLDEPGHLDLLVKQYPNGKSSTHLHSLQPGDHLRFVAAIPSFVWPSSSSSSGPAPTKITLIAGGAGITPLFQLIQGLLESPQDELPDSKSSSSSSSSSNKPPTGEKTTRSIPVPQKITLIFGVNTPRDILLKDRLDEYERRFPGRFRTVYAVSNPNPVAAAGTTTSTATQQQPFTTGYITKELLQKELGTTMTKTGEEQEQWRGAGKENEKVFVCGPPAMEASLLGGGGGRKKGGILGELGYTKDQIHKF